MILHGSPLYLRYPNLKSLLKDIEYKYLDIKANDDLTEINNIIVIAKPTEQYIEKAKRLHKRINSDYPEIDEMCNLALTLKSDVNDNETKRKSDIESIKDCLITDAFGILASVLIKHKKIETIKEFIKSVD